MRSRRFLVALAALAGVGLALHLRPPRREVGAGPSRVQPGTRGEDLPSSTAIRAAREPALRGQLLGTRSASSAVARPVYDLTRNDAADQLPVDVDRDAAWATPMEAALAQHGRAELLDLMPDAVWLGVTCRTRTCTVRYQTRPQPPEVMAIIQSFVLGPGTAHQHEVLDRADGAVEWLVTVAVRDEATHERLTADAYLARQGQLSPDRRDLRDQVRDHLHNHPDDHH